LVKLLTGLNGVLVIGFNHWIVYPIYRPSIRSNLRAKDEDGGSRMANGKNIKKRQEGIAPGKPPAPPEKNNKTAVTKKRFCKDNCVNGFLV